MAEDDFLVRRQRQLSQKAEQEALATRRKAALRSLAKCIREMRESGLSHDQIAGELRPAANATHWSSKSRGSRATPFAIRRASSIFADQAVIAIENVRLFDEVQARTDELSKSLQQQTATADVLKVISRSAFDLKSVLQTLVEWAGRLCEADFATITRQKDGVLFFAEAYGYSPEFIEYLRALPVERGRGTATGRALLEGQAIHIADVLADSDYTWAEAQRLGGYRTVLGLPMMREGVGRRN